MKKIVKGLDFFKGIRDSLKDLVNVTTPSNHKTLLDVISNLYYDEVSRYRYLEEKSSRILSMVAFLLPSTSTMLYFLYSKDISLFDKPLTILIVLALGALLISLSYVLSIFSITFKPVLKFSEEYINELDAVGFEEIYLELIDIYQKHVALYRRVNKKKAKNCKYAHNALVIYFFFSSCIIIKIIVTLIYPA